MVQIWNFMLSFFRETAFLYNEMAIYLLLGFAAGGIIHAFFPQERIRQSIGRRGFLSSLKSSLLGVPMPLCSCSVVPTSLALRRSGASPGATVSFLISTPQTGVDSIAATYSLLGPVYAAFRPVVAFVTGTLGGFLMDLGHGQPLAEGGEEAERTRPATLRGKLELAYDYGFHSLLKDIARWIVVGIILGGAISAAVPAHFLELSGGNMVFSYLGALLFSVPLYVCATGSTPIAAALVLKGLSPGAAFVLLMAGPATNAASITVLWKMLGRRATLIYLAVIIGGSLAAGIFFDTFLRAPFAQSFAGWHEEGSPLTMTLKLVGSGVFLFFLAKAFWPQRRSPKSSAGADPDLQAYHVEGMTCDGCRNKVERAARSVEGVEQVEAHTSSATLYAGGAYDEEQFLAAVKGAGYPISRITGN
jgi:uncharacterized membrane protein YraQ (UPF0718 family)/copper chaperone CopZ